MPHTVMVKSYLKLFLSVVVVLAVYKLAIQPFVSKNATLSNYLPSV